MGNCGIFLKRAVSLVFDHRDKSLILNIDHCSGVIVNNKGEMKGSAITGEENPFQKSRCARSIKDITIVATMKKELRFYKTSRPCGQRVRGPVAQDRFERELHLLRAATTELSSSTWSAARTIC